MTMTIKRNVPIPPIQVDDILAFVQAALEIESGPSPTEFECGYLAAMQEVQDQITHVGNSLTSRP
jgi:hypothetical protein